MTSVRIEGVQHEFTTIPGVREDVTDIILNLREMVCRLHGEVGEIEVELSKVGPGTVTAADISAPADLELLNPELEIANARGGLAPGHDPHDQPRPRLRAGRAEQGPGHHDRRDPRGLELLPVLRVRYEVSPARVGQRTDYDKLLLEIQTDGSVNPRGAIAEAAETLIGRLAIFADPESTKLLGEPAVEEVPAGGGMHDIMIEELELGVRSYNCLKRVGVETIGDLISKTESELSAIPNFGKKSIEEVKENLAAHGLGLRSDDE